MTPQKVEFNNCVFLHTFFEKCGKQNDEEKDEMFSGGFFWFDRLETHDC